MAATSISALVIKHNNDVFENTGSLTVGTIMDIPTQGAGGVLDGDFWAVPITDNVVSGFNFIPCAPTDTDAPTAQSFHVFRLTSRFGYDSWYVRGKTTGTDNGSPVTYGYIEAAADAECCSATPRVLPIDVPVIAACQTMCEFDADGKYFGVFPLPTLTGNLRYYPYGYFNDVLGTAATALGYATPDLLLSFLNSGTWGAIGTWTFTDAGKTIAKVTQTAGSGTDVICLEITTVDPSA